VTLLLVAATAAEGYYPHIGMQRVNRAGQFPKSA
jgi:hypothetical protein